MVCERWDGVCCDSRNQASDVGVRAERLSDRYLRLDRREILSVVGLTRFWAGVGIPLTPPRLRSDHNGDLFSVISRDAILFNITLYYLTGTIGSSFSPYYLRHNRGWPLPDGSTISVPTAYIEFPKEILKPPRSVAEKVYTDIRRWTVAERGGHFAGLQEPGVLARDVRAFFGELM